MTLPAFATPKGVTDRGGPRCDPARMLAAITDVSALIHSATGNRWIAEGGTLDPGTPDVLFTVAYRAIIRALSERSTSEQIGPFGQTVGAFGGGEAFLTAQDKADIADAGGSTSGLGVIRLEAPWPTHRRTGFYEDDDE